MLDAAGNPVDYASGDPVANLDLIRSTFFPRAGVSLGQRSKLVVSQAFAYDRRHPSDAEFVENVLWVQSNVLFVTIDLPGGSNNDTDIWYGSPTETAAQTQARSERTGADLRWLDAAFFVAKLTGAKGVVIGAQADMWDPEKGAAHQAGYEPFVSSVARHTSELRQACPDVQRRLPRLPVGQPALAHQLVYLGAGQRLHLRRVHASRL